MSYCQYFSICERAKTEELDKLDFSSRAIGKRLNRHHSSISRELARLGNDKPYKAEIAQADYAARRTSSRPKGKWSKSLMA